MNVIELQRALRQLRCSGMAGGLEARLLEAQAEKLVPLDFLSRLVQDELLRRQDRLLARRGRGARSARSATAFTVGTANSGSAGSSASWPSSRNTAPSSSRTRAPRPWSLAWRSTVSSAATSSGSHRPRSRCARSIR